MKIEEGIEMYNIYYISTVGERHNTICIYLDIYGRPRIMKEFSSKRLILLETVISFVHGKDKTVLPEPECQYID